MRIGSRIVSGFATVVLLSTAVGMVGWFSLSTVVDAARVSSQAEDLVSQVKALHADVTRFDHEGDTAEADIIKSALGEIGQVLDRVIAANPWTTEDVDAAHGALQALSDTFSALVDATRKNKDALDSMAKRNADIGARIEALETLRVTDGGGIKDELFTLRLNLASMHSAEQSLGSGHIDDATDQMMDALRAIFRAGMTLKQIGDPHLSEAVGTITETMHAYRKEFESIREAADSRRQTVDAINQAVAQLETLLSGSATREKTRMDTVMHHATSILLSGVLCGLLGGGVLALVLTRSIVRPVKSLTGSMQRLAEGDLAADVVEAARKDEIGSMARAVEVFKRNAEEVLRLQAEQVERERQVSQERRRVRQQLAEEIRSVLGSVVDGVATAASKLHDSAQALSASSEQTNQQAVFVAATARQALDNVEAVSNATRHLADAAGDIGHRAEASSNIAREAVDETERTNATIESLSASARNIIKVANLIRVVASQTNLLALNATIEAHRAGEAGKGFAIVADEVKGLATQTGQATAEIDRQIQEIQNETDDAASALGKVIEIIAKMSAFSKQVVETVKGQTSATQAIVANLSHVAQGTREVSSNIDRVTDAADLTGREASRVLEAALSLTRDAQTLRTEIDSLITRISS